MYTRTSSRSRNGRSYSEQDPGARKKVPLPSSRYSTVSPVFERVHYGWVKRKSEGVLTTNRGMDRRAAQFESRVFARKYAMLLVILSACFFMKVGQDMLAGWASTNTVVGRATARMEATQQAFQVAATATALSTFGFGSDGEDLSAGGVVVTATATLSVDGTLPTVVTAISTRGPVTYPGVPINIAPGGPITKTDDGGLFSEDRPSQKER